jgi:hypothetical protein
MGGESKTSSTQNSARPIRGSRRKALLRASSGSSVATSTTRASLGPRTTRSTRWSTTATPRPRTMRQRSRTTPRACWAVAARRIRPARSTRTINYQSQTNPLASNTNYNPTTRRGFVMRSIHATSDITNSTNGQFAAAGRDFSPANSTALPRPDAGPRPDDRGSVQSERPEPAGRGRQPLQRRQHQFWHPRRAPAAEACEPGAGRHCDGSGDRRCQRRRERHVAGRSGAARHSRCRRLGFSLRSAFRLRGLAASPRARATRSTRRAARNSSGRSRAALWVVWRRRRHDGRQYLQDDLRSPRQGRHYPGRDAVRRHACVSLPLHRPARIPDRLDGAGRREVRA